MKLGRTWLKVERAARHLIELRGQISRIEAAPFEVRETRDENNGDRVWVIDSKDNAEHLLGVSMYGVIAGDFVHNLRSALDHAVWQLADPPGIANAFPICLDERATRGSFWGGKGNRAVGPYRLKNVPQPAADYIESVQPYHRFQTRDPLWQLNELWNEDKHRTLLVVGDPSWSTPLIVATRDGRDTYPGEVKDRDPEHPAEIFRLDAKSDSEVTFGQPRRVEIRFASPAVVAGQSVTSALDWMLRYVSTDILPGVESYL
jgi:hypothetical protein